MFLGFLHLASIFTPSTHNTAIVTFFLEVLILFLDAHVSCTLGQSFARICKGIASGRDAKGKWSIFQTRHNHS
ncbi:hypothetical protein CPB83DRAFT_856754 [Crepidotus variabilis]|uniref:Uncharacterized protein n=1 Tax=Crepidotus variabilis TaxID=179855 RepID=A0A9P6JN79_9AGAR|nr:hypothetical protein CPB83DRAFT_856754 [Crepidotus variabilis]